MEAVVGQGCTGLAQLQFDGAEIREAAKDVHGGVALERLTGVERQRAVVAGGGIKRSTGSQVERCAVGNRASPGQRQCAGGEGRVAAVSVDIAEPQAAAHQG